jgi:ribosome-associated translation inhibitor RaiA
MTIIVRYCGVTKCAFWQNLVETRFRGLQNEAAISTARVTLAWERGMTPAFRVFAHLEVPGPDFHAEATDHTLAAALTKAIKSLQRQIRARKRRRADRWKTNPHPGLTRGRCLTSSGCLRQ